MIWMRGDQVLYLSVSSFANFWGTSSTKYKFRLLIAKINAKGSLGERTVIIVISMSI